MAFVTLSPPRNFCPGAATAPGHFFEFLRMPDPSDLTTAERATLEGLQKSIRYKGFPPTVRELAGSLGLTAAAAVHERLGHLVDKGFVTKHERGQRCYVPIDYSTPYVLPFDLDQKVKACAKASRIKPSTLVNEAVASYVETI